MTRPDVSYPVQCLSQYMHCPLHSHVKAASRVLRYLKSSPGSGVQIKKSPGLFFLVAYSDADWGKCLESRKSVSGYCIYLCGNLISWKSKKQPTVSKSSNESEYRALSYTTCELIWIVKMLKDLKIDNLLPIKLYCDNKSALQLTVNPVFHERSKHFEIDVVTPHYSGVQARGGALLGREVVIALSKVSVSNGVW
ncbi:secreted RxLR effector protein 161-like [Rutidosis leptorrhynchoides]|uniref:secreted RxLR effector protein 161-like n=1 Tax=Rutidosis leptorrhynchoides TaxID=125765 RepID=UPI003A9A5372